MSLSSHVSLQCGEAGPNCYKFALIIIIDMRWLPALCVVPDILEPFLGSKPNECHKLLSPEPSAPSRLTVVVVDRVISYNVSHRRAYARCRRRQPSTPPPNPPSSPRLTSAVARRARECGPFAGLCVCQRAALQARFRSRTSISIYLALTLCSESTVR